jgi:hypothetical protein
MHLSRFMASLSPIDLQGQFEKNACPPLVPALLSCFYKTILPVQTFPVTAQRDSDAPSPPGFLA